MQTNLGYQAYVGIKQDSASSPFEYHLECLKRDGFFVLEAVIPPGELETIRGKMDRIWSDQVREFGEEFLKRIGDFGQIRCMMESDPYFLSLIRNEKLFPYVAATVGDTAILHLQNGIVLHPTQKHNQARYHKDFPKDFLSTKMLSLNALIAVDPFSPETGGTWLVPGSHRLEEMPSLQYLEEHSIQVTAKPGSALVFDSLLWHKGGDNLTNASRRAINQQYTRPFIKQQINYPALLNGKVDPESPVAQTLGFWSVSPRSVQEFRVTDPKLRTYRAGQG